MKDIPIVIAGGPDAPMTTTAPMEALPAWKTLGRKIDPKRVHAALEAHHYYDGPSHPHDFEYDRMEEAIAAADAALTASPAQDEGDEAYKLGKEDGYSEAMQEIDRLTGGDGEYCYCMGHDSDRHCPDPAAMKARIVERFENLNTPQPAQDMHELPVTAPDDIGRLVDRVNGWEKVVRDNYNVPALNLVLIEASTALLSQQSEINRLVTLLEPFAKAADIRLCGEWSDDKRIQGTDTAFYITFGDLRRARAALPKDRT